MGEIRLGDKVIGRGKPAFVIAEIGHNHQGELEKAKKMIAVAAECGVDAVKFQKRENRSLFTKAMFDKPYDNENSFGATYGEHRDFLEFGEKEFVELMQCAKDHGVEFMCTAFDVESADFLEKLGVRSFKFASGDLTNTPLLEYVAKKGKPMFISTGAATFDEIKLAYETVIKYNTQICFLQTTCVYPADYDQLHLRAIEMMGKAFPEAVMGYSGHDNGILAGVVAYMLGATVIEKHFTLNRSWKGTDHKFSLEPEGLRKQVRDLRRVDLALGKPEKVVYDYEASAKAKMGKSVYTSRALTKGHVLRAEDLCLKSPAGGLPPYRMRELVGKGLALDCAEETMLSIDMVAGAADRGS
jgi:N-acetylneuraminate synthase/sialic acid synthase